jgi:hypothetical protein
MKPAVMRWLKEWTKVGVWMWTDIAKHGEVLEVVRFRSGWFAIHGPDRNYNLNSLHSHCGWTELGFSWLQ